MRDGRYIMLKRWEDSEALRHLLLHDHNAFILLTIIAQRARRQKHKSLAGVEQYQAMIGDYKKYGMTEQKYRTSKQHLETYGLATFKGTRKGTIATLINTEVFDINAVFATDTITDSQRTANGQPTTKKKEKNDKKGEMVVEEDAREALDILHCCSKLADLSVDQWNEITADRSTLPADLPAAAERIRREAVLCNDPIRHPAVWVAERLSFSGRKESGGQNSQKKPAPGFTRLGTPLRLITPQGEKPKKTRADELREMAEKCIREQQEAATA